MKYLFLLFNLSVTIYAAYNNLLFAAIGWYGFSIYAFLFDLQKEKLKEFKTLIERRFPSYKAERDFQRILRGDLYEN